MEDDIYFGLISILITHFHFSISMRFFFCSSNGVFSMNSYNNYSGPAVKVASIPVLLLLLLLLLLLRLFLLLFISSSSSFLFLKCREKRRSHGKMAKQRGLLAIRRPLETAIRIKKEQERRREGERQRESNKEGGRERRESKLHLRKEKNS
jgi:hypothetical protein